MSIEMSPRKNPPSVGCCRSAAVLENCYPAEALKATAIAENRSSRTVSRWWVRCSAVISCDGRNESIRHLVSLHETKSDIEKYNRALDAIELASKFNVHRIRSLLCRLTTTSLLKCEPPLSATCTAVKSTSTRRCSVLSETLVLSSSCQRQRTDELVHPPEPARVPPQRFDVPTSHLKGWLFCFRLTCIQRKTPHEFGKKMKKRCSGERHIGVTTDAYCTPRHSVGCKEKHSFFLVQSLTFSGTV